MSDMERAAWLDPEIPEYFQPTALLLDRHVEQGLGSKIALSVDADSYSYAQLLDVVKDTVARLVAVDIHPGERILLFGRDSLEYIAYWLAAVRVGAVPVVVSDAYHATDLVYFLQDTAARVLVIDSEQWHKVQEQSAQMPDTLKTIVVRDGAVAFDAHQAHPHGLQRIQAHSSFVIDAAAREEHVTPHRDDIAYMFYSGGTTGRAKGIVHLVSDFAVIPERQGAYWNYVADDIVHATSKKYFTHGLWPGVLIPLYWSAHSVISRENATGANVLELLQKYRPNKWITVPTVVKNVIVELQTQVSTKGVAHTFEFLELAVTASEKLPLAFFKQFEELFGLKLLDSIGSAEVTYEWIANRPQEHRDGSLGKPVYGYEIRLRDGHGNIVTQPGVKGQAEVRSVTATPFYWRKRTLSQEKIVDGWVRTGDELYFDEDGFFWFAARSNDVFKVQGLWVSPLEIEDSLASDGHVHEAAVVPYQDADGLTRPKAYLVVEKGFAPSSDWEQSLRDRVRKALGGYKVPAAFAYLEQLPKTTLLKIDRKSLRDAPQR